MGHQCKARPRQCRFRGRHRGGRRWTAEASAQLGIQIHDVHPRVSRSLLHDGRGRKGLAGLANPRGFILVDKCQRSPTFKNIFAVGVGIAIPPFEPTPVPVGVPKTGYMIESMVAAVAENIRDLIAGSRAAKRLGAPSVSPISVTAVWLLSQSRKSRRVISTGPAKGTGSIWRKSPSRNISCARSARVWRNPFMNA
jgi:hypothetical protein